jgi:hypothetical protein
MKRYFYSDGKTKEGPITFSELINKDLKPHSLIWYEGLENWLEAEKIEELREIFELKPPPLDNLIAQSNLSDLTPLLPNQALNGNISSNNHKSLKVPGPFSFDGRIGRGALGFSFVLFILGILFVYFVAIGLESIMVGALLTPLFWFIRAQMSKRCHDLGNSGWFQFIPLYTFILLFKKGQIGPNKYGDNTEG